MLNYVNNSDRHFKVRYCKWRVGRLWVARNEHYNYFRKEMILHRVTVMQ